MAENKKHTCGECIYFNESLPQSNKCIYPSRWSIAPKEPINFCKEFKLKPSADDGKKETNPKDVIRTFGTGATRDTVEGKLSYVKALSPIVLQRYVQYLDAHRKQPDGSMREFDNWKQGIPEEAYLDGLGRHFVATWLLAQGYSAEDNHGPVTLQDSLCAIIFGVSGWLHELLEKELKENKNAKTN